MRGRESEAIDIVNEFFEVKGRFSASRPEGMAASTYTRDLANYLAGVDEKLRSEVVGVLLQSAMEGSNSLSAGSGHVCADLAIGGMRTAFATHINRVRNWFAKGIQTGWWRNDAGYESAPMEAKGFIHLMNVLWCCDREAAERLSDTILAQTTNEAVRESLTRSKFLPRVLDAMPPSDR